MENKTNYKGIPCNICGKENTLDIKGEYLCDECIEKELKKMQDEFAKKKNIRRDIS